MWRFLKLISFKYKLSKKTINSHKEFKVGFPCLLLLFISEKTFSNLLQVPEGKQRAFFFSLTLTVLEKVHHSLGDCKSNICAKDHFKGFSQILSLQ